MTIAEHSFVFASHVSAKRLVGADTQNFSVTQASLVHYSPKIYMFSEENVFY